VCLLFGEFLQLANTPRAPSLVDSRDQGKMTQHPVLLAPASLLLKFDSLGPTRCLPRIPSQGLL